MENILNGFADLLDEEVGRLTTADGELLEVPVKWRALATAAVACLAALILLPTSGAEDQAGARVFDALVRGLRTFMATPKGKVVYLSIDAQTRVNLLRWSVKDGHDKEVQEWLTGWVVGSLPGSK